MQASLSHVLLCLSLAASDLIFPNKLSSSHFNIIAKDYITGLMQLDPEVRWSSREALEHPWYVDSWEWGRPVAGHGAELHTFDFPLKITNLFS